MGTLTLLDHLRKILTDSRPQRSARRRGRQLTKLTALEPLEDRRLLSGSPFTYTATNVDSLRLKVAGNNLDVIDDKTHAVLQAVPLASVSQVQINGFSGGKQTLTVDTSGGQFPIPIIDNSVGSGNILQVNDSTNAKATNYTVSNVEVSVGATAIAFNATLTGGLVLSTGTGADYVNVVSTNSQVPTTINSSGGGVTQFSVGGPFTSSGGLGTGSLANIAGPLTLGSHGVDKLTFLDNGNTAADFYSITSTGLSWSNTGSLTYGGAQSITLASDSASGSIFVRSLPASTTYVELAPLGTGKALDISPAALNTTVNRTIDASSLVAANAGDLLTVDDSTDTRWGVNYGVYNDAVTVGVPTPWSSVATTVDYGAGVSGGLVINTGTGSGDVGSVYSTLAAVSVAINTSGVNATTINVGAGSGNSLNSVAGGLTLQTYAVDQISFNDQGDAAPANYKVTSNALLWNNSIIGYRSVAAISVTTGSATGDTLFVSSLPASTTRVTLSPSGQRADFIASPAVLQVSGRVIDAGTQIPAGSNTLVTVDDSLDTTANVAYKVTSTSIALSTGTTVLYGANDTGGVVMNLGSGPGDKVSVYSIPAPVLVAINASSANPTTFEVGGDIQAGAGNLAAIAGSLYLKTTPSDAIDFLDQTSGAPASYTLTSTGLQFNNHSIGFATATVIDLFTSTAKDTVSVTSLPTALLEVNFHVENSAAMPGTSITLSSGAMTTSTTQQRTFQLGSSTPNGSGGVPAGAGDTLTVNDSADPAAAVNYAVTATQIGLTSGGNIHNVIDYSANFGYVSLLTGSGAGDVVNITGTAAPLSVITSAAGSAIITVGNSGNLNGIANCLNLVSNSSKDQLTINDSANTAYENYVVTQSYLERGWLYIGYEGFKNFTVLTGSYEKTVKGVAQYDQVIVENLSAGYTVNLTIASTADYFVEPSAVHGKVNLTVL